MESSLSSLIALAGAVGTSALLGVVKKYTTIVDGAVGNVIKPVQPILVTVGAFALPLLAQALGLTEPINAAEFIAAPVAAILTIAAREARARLARVTGK